MTNAPSSINPSPWPPAAYTSIFNKSVKTSYTAYSINAVPAAFPLWNVRVSIDENSSPTATMEGDTYASAVTYMYVRAYTNLVSVHTGYEGQDESRLFIGFLTSIETRSDGTAHITASSLESLLDTFPAITTTYTPGSGLTKLADVITDLRSDGHTFTTGGDIRAYQLGSITNPSSYVAFRAQQLQSTDTILDFLLASANSLGQWLRGDQRGRVTSGFLYTGVGSDIPCRSVHWDVSRLILSDRWSGGTAIDLTPITTDWKYRESVDDYADYLQITAHYKSGGSEVTKVARYGSYVIPPPLTRSIDIQYRAPSSFTAGTDPVAQRWADSYMARTWILNAECRAVWWLEPGMQVTIGENTGTIKSIDFQVDAGTMTRTVRPTYAWTPA